MNGLHAGHAPARRQAAVTGGRVLAAVSVLLVLALVVPAVVATRLSRARVDRARAETGLLAAALAPRIGRAGTAAGAALRAGRGNVPRESVDARWTAGGADPLTDAGGGGTAEAPASPDPWGNRYAANVGVGPGSAVWVLSAGPNGRIETTFEQPAARALASGDDVAARVR